MLPFFSNHAFFGHMWFWSLARGSIRAGQSYWVPCALGTAPLYPFWGMSGCGLQPKSISHTTLHSHWSTEPLHPNPTKLGTVPKLRYTQVTSILLRLVVSWWVILILRWKLNRKLSPRKIVKVSASAQASLMTNRDFVRGILSLKG